MNRVWAQIVPKWGRTAPGHPVRWLPHLLQLGAAVCRRASTSLHMYNGARSCVAGFKTKAAESFVSCADGSSD